MIDPKDTICYKIEDALDRLDKLLADNKSAPGTAGLALMLHEIRHDAQHMENALRLRKKMMMSVPGFEESYQAEKARQDGGKHIPGINKMTGTPQLTLAPVETEVTVKTGDEIVYQKKSFAGLLYSVEEMEKVGPDLVMNGAGQTFQWGPVPAIMFAFDQLGQSVEKYQLILYEVMAKLKGKGKTNKNDYVQAMNDLLEGGDKK